MGATRRILKAVRSSERPSRVGERRWARLAYLRADLRLEEEYFCSARVFRRRASPVSVFSFIVKSVKRRERERGIGRPLTGRVMNLVVQYL